MLLKKTRIALIVIVLFLPYFSNGQTVMGSIKDTLGNPLQNANIIAKPLAENNDIKFAIADYLGRFKLDLNKNTPYEIHVSYVGFVEKVIAIKTDFSNQELNFTLTKKDKEIKEIIIKYDYKPIVLKKDTIVYDIKAFTNGTERKLKDQLEKIPGVEVDKNGGVTIQGKKVTNFYVENQSFFGGGTKLGVENIPADAVEKVEIIDNFNEVNFLKKVSDSKDLAMNIKLKADKKKFVFGDIQAGGGKSKYDNHYLNHAGLFYFSPQSSISFIGDLNNIGKQVFSTEDLIHFQGGSSNFISDRKQLTNMYEFANQKTDFLKNKSQFGALNFRQTINDKINISGFGLFSTIQSNFLINNTIEYLQNTSKTIEERINNGQNKGNLSIGNIKINYAPSSGEKWLYNGQFQSNSNDNYSTLNSSTANQQTSFTTFNLTNNVQFKHFLEWHKQYNNNHTTTFVINHSYDNQKPINTWLTNSEFLVGLIPLLNDSFYTIQQVKKVTNSRLDMLFKHYWVINNYNHFYSNIGANFDSSRLQITEKQYLTSGTINDFVTNGFGNNINYLLKNFYLGFEYKFKIGKWVNKPSVYLHRYYLKTEQIDTNYILNRSFLQPSWSSEFEFNPSENLKLTYQLINEFPEASRLADRYTLQTYNSVYKGNALLGNERFHNAYLNYTKTSLIKNLFVFANASYTKKTKTIRDSIELEGINQFTTPILTNNPETTYRINGSIDKKIYKFRFGLNANFSWFNYIQSINNESQTNKRNNQSFGLRLRTATNKWPSTSISYTKIFSQFYGLTNSNLVTDKFIFNFDVVFCKNFSFKTDYEAVFNKNSNVVATRFNVANAYLSFQKKNNAFLVELSARNYLNNGTKINNSFSDFMISNTTTYILPRIIMLTVSYKL